MNSMKNVGLLPLGRNTFDVPYANEKLAGMLTQLDATGHTLAGPRSLLLDGDTTLAAMDELEHFDIDLLLVLQVTFTDAAMISLAANRFSVPLLIWAVPEPRLGERLRLNAFCGLNLASHALGLNHAPFGWLYQNPDERCLPALQSLIEGERSKQELVASSASRYSSNRGDTIARSLSGKRVACIGDHPEGFATCAYHPAVAKDLTGIEVEKIELAALFESARNADPEATEAVAAAARRLLPNIDEVDSAELDRSLRLKVALDTIKSRGQFDAFAIRCWPETFTEYGGAVCGPVSMLGEAKVPCACEADVYGAMTQLVLQEVADAPVFLVDVVDINSDDDSAVVWHCGQAPVSMAHPDVQPAATIHTNRKMPLLFEFPLKPGRVTFARLSQSGGIPKMIIASGEMMDRPLAFTGTSGVVRFDDGAAMMLEKVIDSGLEHHLGAGLWGSSRNIAVGGGRAWTALA